MWPDSVVLSLKAWPSGDHYDFSGAAYDADTDRLELTWGPETAASASLSPEGHIIRRAAPDGYFCGVVLTDVRQRLADHGRIELTLGPREFVCLNVADVAHALGESGLRRTGRFERRAADLRLCAP